MSNKWKVFANNAYAVKTVWEISKRRVIHTALYSIVGYVEWIFMSIFFLRYVMGSHAELLDFGGKYAKMWIVQAGQYI